MAPTTPSTKRKLRTPSKKAANAASPALATISGYTILPVQGHGGIVRNLYFKLHTDRESNNACSTLFVANIHEDTTQSDLERIFASLGTVRAVEMDYLKASSSGRTRFARVSFEDSSTLNSKLSNFHPSLPREVAEAQENVAGIASKLCICMHFLFGLL